MLELGVFPPAMPAVFDALPGVEVPVGGISAGFGKLWADSPARESRAVQLNLVLHLGANSTPADAQMVRSRREAPRRWKKRRSMPEPLR